MSKDKKNDELENDLSLDEFEEIYDESPEGLDGVTDLSDLSEEDITDESDLDFVEEDIEELSGQNEEEIFEEDNLSGFDESLEPKKKKSSFLTILLLLIIGGGGAAAYFMDMIPGLSPNGSRSYQVATNDTSDTSVTNDINEDIFGDQPMDDDSQSAQNIDEIDNLYNNSIAEERSSNQIPDIATINKANAPKEQPSGFVQEAENDNDVSDSAIVQDIVVNDPFVPQEEVVSNNIAPSNVNNNSQDLSELQNNLDQLDNRINSIQSNLDTKLSAIETSVTNLRSTDNGISENVSIDNSQLDSIKNSIDALTAKVNGLANDVAAVKKAQAEQSKKVVSAPKKEPVKATPKKASAPKKVVTPKRSWEIRAIQVGKAVIAEKGKGGTRNVVVGDNVPGLGTIRDINYKNGGWVIEGSSGSIKQ